MILQTTSANVRKSFHVIADHSLPGVGLTAYRLRYAHSEIIHYSAKCVNIKLDINKSEVYNNKKGAYR
jgi:hypothetical protein